MIEQLQFEWEDFYFYFPDNAEILPLHGDGVVIVANNWFLGAFKNVIQSLPSQNYVSVMIIETFGQEYEKVYSNRRILKRRAHGLFRELLKITPSHKIMTLYSLDKREDDHIEVYDQRNCLFQAKTFKNGSLLYG